MFRRLYFITEQTDAGGVFRSTGAYTSVHDLIDTGLRWVGPTTGLFRVSLVKLDCRGDVLGSWDGPQFDGLEAKFQAFVQTGEFGVDEVNALRQALNAFSATAVTR